MKGAIIIDVVKVVLKNILLELHFNIQIVNKKLSFQMNISDDGETVLFTENENWVALHENNQKSYRVIKVSKDNDELAKLLGSEILNVRLGLGKTLENKNVIYYVKIDTNKDEFLFFNNGDEGAYSFDKITEILANDIYGYEWVEFSSNASSRE